MEKSNQLKNYLRDIRKEEISRFSPKAINQTSTIEQRSLSIPLSQTLTSFNQPSYNMPPAGVIISPLKKQNKPQPVYDDFLNSVFSNKQNKSYMLREKADMRSSLMDKKFKNSYNIGGADEKRIQADYEKQLLKDAKTFEDKK